MDSVAGHRIAVVGGSSGIGLATARAVVEAGGEVVVGSRSDAEREDAVEELGVRAVGEALDLTDIDSVDTFFDAAGALDGLVCTPAYVPMGRVSDVEDSDLERAFDVKLFGYRRAALAADLADDAGVVFVSGTAADRPTPDLFAIGVVNAAVESLGRYLAVDLAPVRVNVVSPGIVDTWGMPDERRAAISESVPTGRVTVPEDVSDTIIYGLTNPATTGTVLTVDGGSGLS